MTSHGGRAGLVALIAALVIACGGTAPSTSPSVATPTNSPSSGPTSTPDSTPAGSEPSTSPSPDPTGTPEPQEGWIQLAAASDASATWSPDAAHLLVALTIPGGPPDGNQVQVLARDGTVLQTHEGVSDPVWLDSQRFVAYRLDWEQDESGEWSPATGPNGERLGTAELGSIDSDLLAIVEVPVLPALSNGTGALALTRFDANGLPETAVWSDGVLTEWRSGSPLTWSAAGEKLAFVLPQRSGPANEGPLEVVSWPGLATVWQSGPEVSVSTADFDPTGTYLAYPEFVEQPRQPRQAPTFNLMLNVINLAAGNSIGIPAPENGDFSWLSEERLIVVGFELLEASVIDFDGAVLAQQSVVGPNVIASADGLTALFYDAELDAPQMQILRGDELTLLDSPGLMTAQAPHMARDGSGVLVVVRAATSSPTGSPATVLLHNL